MIDHLSGTTIARGLKRLWMELQKRATLPPFTEGLEPRLAADRVYRPKFVTKPGCGLLPHSFHPCLDLISKRYAFLWHFPWGHPRLPLATIPLYAARTFLRPPRGPATD